MIVFSCHVCRTDLSADEAQAGQLVRCRNCLSTLRVPGGATDPAAALVAMQTPTGESAESADPADSTDSTSAQPANDNIFTNPSAYGVGAEQPIASQPSGYPASQPIPSQPYPPPQASGQQGFYPPPGAMSGAMYGARPVGRRYGFNCGFCSSRLEATEAVAAQDGQCPTCGNTITIPILDRYGRLIDPKTNKIIKQDPHPVHAYAAAGERAPLIVKQADGTRAIRCSRCGGVSAITTNNCRSCGMPFTMEGTTLEAAGGSNGFAVASLVLGIIGIPSACAIIPPVLAIVFGVVALTQIGKSGQQGGGKGMAIAGIILGAIGCLIGLAMITSR